jgi:hypothetical protein
MKSRRECDSTKESSSVRNRRSHKGTKLSRGSYWKKFQPNKKSEGFCFSNCREKRNSRTSKDRIMAKKSRRGNSKEDSNCNNSKEQTEYFD